MSHAAAAVAVHKSKVAAGAHVPQTADSAQDSVAGLTSVQTYLTSAEAVTLYQSLCKAADMNPNRHFIKAVLLDRTEYDFHDGYLGDKGIVPVMQTLSQMDVRAMDLRDCRLGTEDIRAICESFERHAKLERLDLRGNRLTDAAAKLLLQFVVKNRRIHEVNLDKSTPRYLRIQQQCIANGCGGRVAGNKAEVTVAAGTCVVCGTPFIQDNGSKSTERNINLLLSTVLDEFAQKRDAASAVGNEVLFRLLVSCCELGDGVLFLCGDACAETLGHELLQCVRYVITTLHFHMPCKQPSLPHLRTATEQLIKEFSEHRSLSDKDYESQPAAVNAHKDFRILRFLDEASPGYKEPKTRCAVCGGKTDGMPSVPSQFIYQLRQDFMKRALTVEGGVGENALVSLSPLLIRLSAILIRYSYEAICSHACVRDLVRYGVYGYRGVIRAYPNEVPLLSCALTMPASVGTTPSTANVASAGRASVATTSTMRLLPQVSFSVVDFVAVTIDDVGEEDIVCALTVASAMEDVDGVPIDPYFLFAMSRRLVKQPRQSIGCELQAVCEAARLCGCLAEAEAPFRRRHGERPGKRGGGRGDHRSEHHGDTHLAQGERPTFSVGEWDTWGPAFGEDAVTSMLHSAFARRRQGVYMVDGPHGNLFDNIRAALWNFRNQRRSVLVAIEFSAHWLTSDNGLITEMECGGPSSDKASYDIDCTNFFTTVKIVGQSIIANTSYLILQANFGPTAGNRGFFYVDKGTFLRRVTGNAYMFLDVAALKQNTSAASAHLGGPSSAHVPPASSHASAAAVNVAAHLSHTRTAFMEMSCLPGQSRLLPEMRSKLMRAVVEEMNRDLGVSARHASRGDVGKGGLSATKAVKRWFDYFYKLLDVQGVVAASQALFLLQEVCPRDVAERFSRVVSRLRDDFPSLGLSMLEEAEAGLQKSGARSTSARQLNTKAQLSTQQRLHLDDDAWVVIAPDAAPVTVPFTEPGANDTHDPGRLGGTTSGGLPSTGSSTARTGRKHGERESNAPSSGKPGSRRDRSDSGGTRAKSSPGKANPANRRSSTRATAQAASSSRKSSARSGKSSATSSRSSSASVRKNSRPPQKRSPSVTSSGAKRPPSREKKSKGKSRRSSAREASAERRAGDQGTSLPSQQRNVDNSNAARTTGPDTQPLQEEQRRGASAAREDHSERTNPLSTPVEDSKTGTVQASALPAHLIGQPWSLIHLVDTNGVPTRYVAAFVCDHVCVYALAPPLGGGCGHVVLPLMPIRECPIFSELPLSTGFDCAFNHPMEPRKVFFISGTMAFVWDAFLQETVAGPFPLNSSPMFARLPQVFRSNGGKKLECVVPIPKTPLVLLFGQLLYVVYNLDTGTPLSEPLVLQKSSSAEERVKSDGLLAMAGEARADAHARQKQQKSGFIGDGAGVSSGGDGNPTGDEMWNKAVPLFSDDVVSHVPRSPLTSVWLSAARWTETTAGTDDETRGERSRFTLLMPDGETLTLHFPVDPAKWRNFCFARAHSEPIRSTPLRNLPAVFQQSSLASLPQLCAAALQGALAASPTEWGDLEPFCSLPPPAPTSDGSQQEKGGVTVSSSLPSTTVASSNPLSLLALHEREEERARGQQAFGGDRHHKQDRLREHVHYTGEQLSKYYRTDKARRSSSALGSASPVMAHTLTMDLGEGVYESFCAVVLVLDCSRVHPLVMTHGCVKVGVEVSDDGVLYRPHTQFLLGQGSDGSVTACVFPEEVHVSRFWQLRFHSDFPPEVGVVRTIWYRRAGSNTMNNASSLSVSAPSSSDAAPVIPSRVLEPLQTYLIPRDAHITVEAPHVLCEPRYLLDHVPTRPVFSTATNVSKPTSSAVRCTADDPMGWLPAHTVLPLVHTPTKYEAQEGQEAAQPLRLKSAALFFCGEDFAEYDASQRDVVSHRSYTLSEHPCFHDLPYPFSRGFQSAFYLDPSGHPDTVVLFADGRLLQWELSPGSLHSTNAPTPFSETAIMKGVPIHVPGSHEVIAIVNDWRRANELVILYRVRGVNRPGDRRLGGIELLRWNFVNHELVERPVPLCEHPHFGPALANVSAESQLHCVYMNADFCFVAFVDDLVVTIATPSNGGDMSTAQVKSPQRGSERLDVSHAFHRLVTHLPEWGHPRYRSVVSLDLGSEPVLVLGLELTSTHSVTHAGSGEEWAVAYSDDGHRWTEVGHHTHHGLCSRGTWNPATVGHVSHRYWRLTTSTNGHLCRNSTWDLSEEAQELQLSFGSGGESSKSESPSVAQHPSKTQPNYLYMQLRLLTLPERTYVNPPHRLALSPPGSTADSCDVDGGTVPRTEDCGGLPVSGFPTTVTFAAAQVPVSLTLDYGVSAPELCGFQCTRTRLEQDSSARPALESLEGLMTEERWTVQCSDDGNVWSECGTWSMDVLATTIHLRWAPCSPSRYWRVTTYPISLDSAHVRWSNISVSAYSGHSVFVRSLQTAQTRTQADVVVPTHATDSSLKADSMTSCPVGGSTMAARADVNSPVCAHTYVTSAAIFETTVLPVAAPPPASSSLLPLRIGNCLTVDTKIPSPAAITGILMEYDPQHPANQRTAAVASRVEFLVEFSTNGKHWYAATSVLFFTGQGQPLFARWDMIGSYRFWRLRIVNVDGEEEGAIAFQRLQLFRASPSLYRTFLSQKSVRETIRHSLTPSETIDVRHSGGTADRGVLGDVYEAEMVYLRLPSQMGVVRVTASLPPHTAYAVERLEPDGISWASVSVLRHTGTACTGDGYAKVTAAWPRGLASSTWRLRCLTPDLKEPLALPVTWYAFANERAVVVDLNKVADVHFAHSGLTELLPGELLFRGKTALEASKAVLRAEAIPNEPAPSPKPQRAGGRAKNATKSTKGRPSASQPQKQPSLEEPESPTTGGAPVRRVKRLTEPNLEWTFPAPVLFHQLALKGSVYVPAAESDPGEGHNVDATAEQKESGSGVSSAQSTHRPPETSRGPADIPHADTAAVVHSLNAGADGTGAKSPVFACDSTWRSDVTGTGSGWGVGPQESALQTATIVVETSSNGVDYVAVAACALANMSLGKVLTWDRAEHGPAAAAAPHWRVRFEALPADYALDLVSATWYSVCGLPGYVTPADTLVTSNTSYATWQRDVFNREEAFCDACQRGFDQAKSQASKLRDDGDLDRVGVVADAVWRMKKRYAAFVAKTSKDVAHKAGGADEAQLLRRAPAHLHGYFSQGRDLASDLLLFIYKTMDRYPESDVLRLIELVGYPINLGRGLNFSKRDGPGWFYPRFSIFGGVKGDFHGMDGAMVWAAFHVYWSQSLAVQRESDVLLVSPSASTGQASNTERRLKKKAPNPTAAAASPMLSDLSPHVASPFLSVFWEHKKGTMWVPTESFLGLPVLAFAGFGHPVTVPFAPSDSQGFNASFPPSATATTQQPSKSPGTFMVCAINEMTFSERYPLTLGEGGTTKSLPPPLFPFRITAGVNFVQFSTVPSFLVRTLRLLYRQTFLENYRTTLVLTTTSLHSLSGQLRFTLPATEGGTQPGGRVTFGMDDVAIDSLEFEVNIKATPVSGLTGSSHGITGVKESDDLEATTSAMAAGSQGGNGSAAPVERLTLRRRRYTFDFHVNVISHGATYTLQSRAENEEMMKASSPLSTFASAGPPPTNWRTFPVSILGNLDGSSALIPLRCRCANANMPLLPLGSLVLSDFEVNVTAERRSSGILRCQRYIIHGNVNSAGNGHTQACSYVVPTGCPWNAVTEVDITLTNVSLREFVTTARQLLDASPPDTTSYQMRRNAEQREWLGELPITVAAARLSVNIAKRHMHSVGGHVHLYNTISQDATFFVCREGITMTGTVPSIAVGNVLVQSRTRPQPQPVRFTIGDLPSLHDSASLPATSRGPTPMVVQIQGYSKLTSATEVSPVCVELTQSHTVVISATDAVDLSLVTRNTAMATRKQTVAYHAVHPSCETATALLNKELFFHRVAAALGRAPLVRSLRAEGMPFTFTPQELSVVEPMRVAQHRLTAVLRGVFFGNWFEVFATTTELVDSHPPTVQALADALALKILEQSQEALWKSYANIVGLRGESEAGSDAFRRSFLGSWQRTVD